MHGMEEVLRLGHECGRSRRKIARACGLSARAVNQVLQRAARAGVGWPLPTDLDGEGLQGRLYGSPAGGQRDTLDFSGYIST